MADTQQVHVSLLCELDVARQIKADFEAAAREELDLLVALIREDAGLNERLGDPIIETLGEGAYLFRRNMRTVAVGVGLMGELHATNPAALMERGTGPAIFVNIVECGVFFDRHRTQNAVLHELADQLKA